MSYVDISLLRGVNDENLPFFPSKIAIGTAQILQDTLTQFQAYIKAGRIVNNDVLNVITYRTGGRGEPLQTVPISSQEDIQGWESFLEINPDPVTGNGILELDLVNRKDALLGK